MKTLQKIIQKKDRRKNEKYIYILNMKKKNLNEFIEKKEEQFSLQKMVFPSS